MRNRLGELVSRHGGAHSALAVVIAAVTSVAAELLFPVLGLALAAMALAALAVVVWAPRASVVAIVVASVVGAVVAQLVQRPGAPAPHGVVLGLVVALCLAGPLAVANMMRQLRAFHRRGWALADAEARKRSAEVREALQRERMSVAAEMHDGLGHTLTLIAVRLGRLSLNSDLPHPVREEISQVRRAAAQAADELGVAVRLLQHPAPEHGGGSPNDIATTVAKARTAGVAIVDELPPDLEAVLSPEAAAAVARVVQEGLTNAAKHAPGSTVTLRGELTGGELRVVVRNALAGGAADDAPPSSGFGLVGLRQRAAVLGGSLAVLRADGAFSLVLSLPADAKPSPASLPDGADVVAAQEDEALQERSRATRTAVVVPAVILGAIAFVAVAYFVLSTVFSVLPPDRFAAIEAGDDQSAVEAILPPLEMLDAPRDRYPSRAGEECRFYEEEISFFERVDVVVVCLDGSRVTRTGTVPAP